MGLLARPAARMVAAPAGSRESPASQPGEAMGGDAGESCQRSAEVARRELESNRQGLAEDLDGLRGELRIVPAVVAGVVVLAILFKGKHVRSGVKLLLKLC